MRKYLSWDFVHKSYWWLVLRRCILRVKLSEVYEYCNDAYHIKTWGCLSLLPVLHLKWLIMFFFVYCSSVVDDILMMPLPLPCVTDDLMKAILWGIHLIMEMPLMEPWEYHSADGIYHELGPLFFHMDPYAMGTPMDSLPHKFYIRS